MGRVFQTLDNHTGERRAVKLLKSEHVNRTKIATRFQREAKLASTLEHEHICPVIDYGISGDGTPFLVMPLLFGQTLHNRLKQKNKPLRTEESTRFALQILDALKAAHDKRIVHRDLKPSNIMLAAQSIYTRRQIFVLDFGISRALDDENRLTTVGGTLGTPAYMAPEQASSLDYDHRIDIYALGVVLYEILTGQRPFDGETPESVKHKIAMRAPRLPSLLNPGIPGALQEAVLTAMAHDPRDRFPTAADMKAALLEASSPSPGTIRVPAQEQTARDIQVNRRCTMTNEASPSRPHEIRVPWLEDKKR